MKLTKFSLAIFLFILVAAGLCASSGLAAEEEPEVDPELTTCKHQCKQQQQFTEDDKHACMQSCEKYHQMKIEREREIEEDIRRRKESEMEEKEKQRHQGEEQEEKEEGNPYVFEDEDFETRSETDDGSFRVLKKFTKKSKLLRGIENFRLATLEAKGHTFVSPCHFDSDAVFFVVKGHATIGLVKGDKTERFNLEPGDIMRVPSGTPVYLVNQDENQNLFIAILHIPLSIPGKFEAFYGPGGRDPESVLTAFSWQALEAALKTPRERLERLFKQQDKGSIFKISKAHVESLSKVKGGFWPFGGQSGGPFNIFKRQIISNQYGRLFQVIPDDHTQLKDLNLILTFLNLTKGSMTGPLYMTRATKIAVITDGYGFLEIACPHVSSSSSGSHSSQGQKSSPSYSGLRAPLRPGMVFVVPTGHPFLVEASNKKNLQMVCFEVNAQGNEMLAFAGKKNIVKALDKEAKELAFNYTADMVDDIFSRDEDFFFPGPGNHDFEEERGRAYA